MTTNRQPMFWLRFITIERIVKLFAPPANKSKRQNDVGQKMHLANPTGRCK